MGDTHPVRRSAHANQSAARSPLSRNGVVLSEKTGCFDCGTMVHLILSVSYGDHVANCGKPATDQFLSNLSIYDESIQVRRPSLTGICQATVPSDHDGNQWLEDEP